MIDYRDLKPAPKQVHHGESLKFAMDIQQRTLSEVAEHMGVTRQAIHRLCQTKKMQGDKAKRLADFFNLTEEEFVELKHRPITSVFDHYAQQIIRILVANHSDKLDGVQRIGKQLAAVTVSINRLESK